MTLHHRLRASTKVDHRPAAGILCAALCLAAAGCAPRAPAGPTVMVLPAKGEGFALFEQHDATCRQYAAAQTGGVSPGRAAASSGVGGAVVGTGVGAAAGALLGSASGHAGAGGRSGHAGAGAAIGAGSGLLAGGLDPPGAVFKYGGPGFQVAGALVEAVTPTPAASHHQDGNQC